MRPLQLVIEEEKENITNMDDQSGSSKAADQRRRRNVRRASPNQSGSQASSANESPSNMFGLENTPEKFLQESILTPKLGTNRRIDSQAKQAGSETLTFSQKDQPPFHSPETRNGPDLAPEVKIKKNHGLAEKKAGIQLYNKMLGTHDNKILLQKKNSKTFQQRDTFLDEVLLDKRDMMDSQVFPPSRNPPSISSRRSRSPEDSRVMTSQLRNVSHSKSKEVSLKHSEENEENENIAQSSANDESLQIDSSPSQQRERQLKQNESSAYLPIQSNPALNLEQALDEHLEQQERLDASRIRQQVSRHPENLSPLENKEESPKDKRSSQEHGLQRFIT